MQYVEHPKWNKHNNNMMEKKRGTSHQWDSLIIFHLLFLLLLERTHDYITWEHIFANINNTIRLHILYNTSVQIFLQNPLIGLCLQGF